MMHYGAAVSTSVLHDVTMIDRGSITPIYIQIADELRGRIQAGEFAPGQRLPSADDLRETYDVAAGTALKALRLLVSDGTAENQHGRGTYVKR